MKIQCNVCEATEATVLCCADEAALCSSCDEKVHAANKLASKHQRVPLSNSNSQMPKCDICQETVGYFFCLEDRALLCRKCDVAIHTANNLVSLHQRFLLTGVKVGLEAVDPGASSSRTSHTVEKISEPRSVTMSTTSQYNNVVPVQATGAGDLEPPKMPFAGGSSAESIQQWPFDEFLGLSDFSPNYYIDNSPPKPDSGKLGESECSPILRALEFELEGEDCLGQVPDVSWAVPQISSPPTTASEFCWPNKTHHHNRHHQFDAAAASVPDICYSPMPNYHQNTSALKRRRHF